MCIEARYGIDARLVADRETRILEEDAVTLGQYFRLFCKMSKRASINVPPMNTYFQNGKLR
jgi:hypothetical protein